MKQFIVGLMMMILLTSCGSKMEETQTPDPVDQPTNLPATSTVGVPLSATDTLNPPTETSLPPLPADPQRIEFSAEDGVNLVGVYYPAAVNPAPMVVLMHWAGGDKNDWVVVGMTDWLNNRKNFIGGAMFSPPRFSLGPYPFQTMPDNLSFGVFTFDFRGYGESDDVDTGLPEGWVLDAKAAYETAGNLPGVAPGMVVGIGASIGSDGVTDACDDGCLGALAISPGSYLKINYLEAVTNLAQKGKKAWCVAALDDPESAPTCENVRLFADQTTIYPSGGHGMMLFSPTLNLTPPIGEVILDFLVQVFGLNN
ncbi:MAG: hypothetical protein ABIJ65_03760 [Chloroflexota bacterium]